MSRSTTASRRALAPIAALAPLAVLTAAASADYHSLNTGTFFSVSTDAPAPTAYGSVILGPEGEARSVAEFDIRSLGIGAHQYVISAMFQSMVTDTEAGGMGVPAGIVPSSLEAFGFVADGVASASDYASGDGNSVGTMNVSSLNVNDVVQYNITSYLSQSLADGVDWLGFSLRATNEGAIGVEQSDLPPGLPRLMVVTFDVACPADVSGDGNLDVDDVLAFLASFANRGNKADFAAPIGTFNVDDVLGFLGEFAEGC